MSAVQVRPQVNPDRATVTALYEGSDEAGRLHRSRVRRLEYETTLRVLARHLPPHARVLELGAGHGAYSLHLARQGHAVTATDLVASSVAAVAGLARAAGIGNVTARQVDAVDLEPFTDGSFDAVLCLGPYYHLRRPDLRLRCLREGRRVLRQGGFVAVSYVNRELAVDALLREGKGELLDAGAPGAGHQGGFFGAAHVATPEEVEADLGAAGLEVLEHVGTDSPYGLRPQLLEAVDEAAFDAYRAHHFATCGQRSKLGAGGHGLVVARAARTGALSPG